MTDLQLEVEPIGESFLLKTRIYKSLKEAISRMNIYDEHADLRLDERGLSERFGISRTPLREALARLERDGLVEIRPRRGVFIVRKSKDDILDMITVWAALESMAARLATESASDHEIAELRALHDAAEARGTEGRMDEYSESNINFHQTIVRMSHSHLIEETINGLFMHVQAIRHRTIFEVDRAERSISEHREIVEALEARDANRAEKLVREHTLRLRKHVENFVEL